VAHRTLDERGHNAALSHVVNGTPVDTIPPAPIRDLSYGPVPYLAGGGGAGSAANPVAERHEPF
jgi:hypothetical protein